MQASPTTANLVSRLRTTILALLVAIVCYLAARLAGALIIRIPQTVWPLWPGCAVLTAILLLVPRKIWPVLLPAGLAGFVIYDLQAGVSIPSIAWLILADISEILVAAWGVSYALNGLPRLNSLKAFAKYSFFTVFLASLVVSSIGGHGLKGDSWLSWRFSFLSEALAFLTVAPAILGLFGQGLPSLRASRASYLEAATLTISVASLTYFMFAAPGRSDPPALLYSLVPFLIWSALRFGSAGVGTLATMVALMSIWGAVHGRGPFIEADPINRVLFLQLFLFFTSIPFMFLAVLVEERKCAQDELHKSTERLRSAMQSGKAVGWEWDLKTGRDSWFGDLKTMFGLPFGTYVGHPEDFHRYIHPEDRQQVAEAVARARKDHQPYAAEFRVVWPDGTQRWVAASGKFLYSLNGEPQRMLGMALDITDRKKLEDDLLESKEQLGGIVASAMDAIIAVDDAQCILLFNAAAAKMFGCRAEDAIGSPIDRFIPERFRTEHSKHIREFGGTGVTSRAMGTLGALWGLRSNGQEFPIEASISYVEHGGKKLFTVIIRDVTARKLAEEALRKSEEKFAKAFRQSPMALAITSARDRRFIEVNETFERVSGWRRHEVIGRTAGDIGLWMDPAESAELSRRIQTEGSLPRLESPFRMRDGSIRTALVGAELIELDGEPCILAVASDITDRKLAEEALRESEARFRLVADTAPSLIWMSGIDKFCTFFNQGWLDFTGRSIESELGNGWADGVHPDDLERCVGTYTQAFDRREKFSVEYRLRRYDGEYRWIFDIGVPRFNQDGSFAGYIGSGTDITDLKLAKEALEKSEEKFAKAFRQSPMALSITRAKDHRYIDVNETFERVSGWRREEIIGRTPFDIRLWVNPQDRGELERQVQAEGGLRLSESQFRMRDGTIRTGLIGAELIELDGEPCVLAVGMDITEQKLAEEALRESESKLRLLLDSTAEAIYGIDLQGRCTFCNPACVRALGYHDPVALLGKNMHHLIHHSYGDGTFFSEEECAILQALRTGEGVHLDDEVLWRANGTSFPAEYWSYPQRRGQEVVGAVVAFIDITERKAAEAALASVGRKLIGAQEQERTRIARELHDDIGQRLALLTIELEQLQLNSPDLPSEVRGRIGQLREQSAEIASDVQSLSHELHSSKLEYLGLATAMRGFCQELSEQQKVEIVFSHDEVPETVPQEISLCLFRVLQEALQNAVKHSGVRRFDVELRHPSDTIELTVRDSGSGFDVDQATNTRGLGLVSMAERVKFVNGGLSIDSRPQHGTTIRARVPLPKTAQASA